MEDGSWIGGYVRSFSTEVEETADRELLLTRPTFRTKDASDTTRLRGSVVVSARRILFLEIAFLDPSDVPQGDRETSAT